MKKSIKDSETMPVAPSSDRLDWQWGVGNAGNAKAFETGWMNDGEEYQLIQGEHPHSRGYDNTYARFPNGRIYAFDGHRIQIKVELETHNYLKTSGLSGDEVRAGGEAKIFFNAQIVYGFFFRDVQWALRRADSIIEQLKSLGAITEWSRKGIESALIGRKVFYKEVPAVITSFIGEQGCVMMDADNEEKLFPVWAYEKREAFQDREKSLKDDMLSPHIWWWRESSHE